MTEIQADEIIRLLTLVVDYLPYVYNFLLALVTFITAFFVVGVIKIIYYIFGKLIFGGV